MEEETVEAVKILEKRDRLDWDYDEAADVLYLSIGRPRKALGLDTGQGVVVRYDDGQKKVVGSPYWACARAQRRWEVDDGGEACH